ncbi:MAG TPA: molybdenum cofactor guanylyltransferase [Candidatus Limnocylindria bacterium]
MSSASGVVLAGGMSRRMGVDKRLILVDGEPLLRRVARVVSVATDELIVVVAPGRPLPDGVLEYLDARVEVDRLADAGPLAGLESGLAAASHELAVVVAADLPLLDARLLRHLVDMLAATDADVVAAATDRGPQPLLAAYRRDPALAAATRLLDAGERRMRALLEVLAVVEVVADVRATTNVNEPADLAEATR